MSAEFIIELGEWDTLRAAASEIREQVFVREQHVPMEMELDQWDAVSLHALARRADGSVVGTARLLPDGHIGRMAVLAEARGHGAGSQLLLALLQAARVRGHTSVLLNAQTHAVPFYARFGFVVEGVEFDDAGIPHRVMRLSWDGSR